MKRVPARFDHGWYSKPPKPIPLLWVLVPIAVVAMVLGLDWLLTVGGAR